MVEPTPAVVRREKIQKMLLQHEKVSIPKLAKAFNVSEMTIRRDLAELERDGHVQRTYGGAISTEKMVFEFDHRQRHQSYLNEKQAIARAAVKMVQPGQRLLLDTGTTVLELALLLRGMDNVTVITPSLAIASTLQFAERIQTILLGGIIRPGSANLYGGLTAQNLELFHADLAFVGADGIDLEGNIYNSDIELAQLDRKMLRQAGKVYILADSSKIGQVSLIRNGSLREVAGLITDGGIAPEHQEALRALGVQVIAGR